MLFVACWRWGSKWRPIYYERLFAGLKRNIAQDFRSVIITDNDRSNCCADILSPIRGKDTPLLEKPGCLVRIRMFDPAWQAEIGAMQGDRIVCIDVDSVITDRLDPLFDRDDDFTIMHGFNTTNACPFQGSLWMLRAGIRSDVWTDFSYDAACRVPFHSIPDDQGWLHSRFPNAGAWTTDDLVFAFKKRGWGVEGRRKLPEGARLVAFPGRDPGKYRDLDWMKEHWR